MQKYLTSTDKDAFLGMEKHSPQHYCLGVDQLVECPVCHGYGKWHLQLNAYGDGKHFDASCYQCSGWGWVEKGSKDAICVHDYQEISQEECRDRGVSHYGACWHVDACVKCGEIRGRDSSD